MISKKQLIYDIKSSKNIIIFNFIIYFLAGPFLSIIQDKNALMYHFFASIFYLFLTSFILPVNIFHFICKRNALDSYYSLPIKRKVFFNTKILLSILVLTVPFLINLILDYIIIFIKFKDIPTKILLRLHFMPISAMILAVLLLGINLWIFNKANNIFDGIVLLIYYHILPFVIIASINSFISLLINNNALFNQDFNYISMIFNIINVLLYFNIENPDYFIRTIPIKNQIISLIIFLFISILSWILFYIEINKRKAEDANQISNNILAYPSLNIISLMSLILVVNYYTIHSISSLFLLYLIIFIVYNIAEFIYKREIKISLKRIIIFISIVLLSNIFSFTIVKTNFFNLAFNYPKNYEKILFNINYYKEGIDFNSSIELEKEDERIKVLEEVEDELVKTYYKQKATKTTKNYADLFNINYRYKIDKDTEYFNYEIDKTYIPQILKKLYDNNIDYKINIEIFNNDDGKISETQLVFSYDEFLKSDIYQKLIEN